MEKQKNPVRKRLLSRSSTGGRGRRKSKHNTQLSGKRRKRRTPKFKSDPADEKDSFSSPSFKRRRASMLSRAVTNATALAKRAMAGVKMGVKKQASEIDFMSILKEQVHGTTCQVRESITWHKYYLVMSDGYLFQFRYEPLNSQEVEDYIVEAFPVQNIEEARVEGKVVTLFLGSRQVRTASKRIRAVDSGQFELLKRYVSLNKRLKVTVSFKNYLEASTFVNKLYSMTIDPSHSLKEVDYLQLSIENDTRPIHFRNLSVHTPSTLPISPELKAMKVKHYFGAIPSHFHLSAHLVGEENASESPPIVANDILDSEVDILDKSLGNKSRNLLNQQVNISVPLGNQYHLFLKLERDLLGYNKYLGSQNIFKRQFHSAMFGIFRLIHSLDDRERKLAAHLLLGVDILLWLLILYFTNSFILAFLTGVIFAWGFQIQAPYVERSLLNMFEPYYITHVLIKSIEDFDFDLKERIPNMSITLEEYNLIEQVREKVLEAMLYDELDDKSYSRQVIQKHILEDFRLVSYLRARDNIIKKAITMAQKATEWRIEYESDKLQEQRNVPEWLLSYMSCPAFVRRYKDDSLPPDSVWLRDVRDNNYATILKAGGLKNKQVLNKLDNDLELAFHYLVWAGEYIKRDLDTLHQESEGAIPYGLTVVIDMANFRISDNPSITRLFSIARQFLPTLVLINSDLLHRVLIINTPTVFFTLWRTIKPLIPSRILQRFELRKATNADTTYRYLSNYLADEQIPAFFGGSFEIDGDEICSDRVMGNGAIDMNAARKVLKSKRE